MHGLGRVRFERLRRGWNQVTLSVYAQLRQHDISLIETGRLVPSPLQLAKLSGAFGIPAADLLKPTVMVVDPEWQDRTAEHAEPVEVAR